MSNRIKEQNISPIVSTSRIHFQQNQRKEYLSNRINELYMSNRIKEQNISPIVLTTRIHFQQNQRKEYLSNRINKLYMSNRIKEQNICPIESTNNEKWKERFTCYFNIFFDYFELHSSTNCSSITIFSGIPFCLEKESIYFYIIKSII